MSSQASDGSTRCPQHEQEKEEDDFKCDKSVRLLVGALVALNFKVGKVKATSRGHSIRFLGNDEMSINWSNLLKYGDNRLFDECLYELCQYMETGLRLTPEPHRLHAFFFYNLLTEVALICENKRRVYKSVLDIVEGTRFGVLFYLKLVLKSGWSELFVSEMLSTRDFSEKMRLINYFNQQLNALTSEVISNQERIHFYLLLELILLKTLPSIEPHLEEDVLSVDKLASEITLKINSYLICRQVYLETYLSFYLFYAEDVISRAIYWIQKAAEFNATVETESEPVITCEMKENIEAYKRSSEWMDRFVCSQIEAEDDAVVEGIKLLKLFSKAAHLKNCWLLLSESCQPETKQLLLKFPSLDSNLLQRLVKSNPSTNTCHNSYLCEFVVQKKPGFRHLLASGIDKFDLFAEHHILTNVSPEVICDPFLFVRCLKKLKHCGDTERQVLAPLLQETARYLRNMNSVHKYLSLRLNTVDVESVSEYDFSPVRCLLQKVTTDETSDIFNELSIQLVGSTILTPLGVLDFLLKEALNSPGLIPIVGRFLARELAPLCKFRSVLISNSESLLVVLMERMLTVFKSESDLNGIIALVKECNKAKYKKGGVGSVLDLDDLLFVFIEEDSLVSEELTESKVYILKQLLASNIVNKNQWEASFEVPAPFIYHLLQFIDNSWYDGYKKQDYLTIFEYVVKQKMNRKLTFDELKWICHEFQDNDIELAILAYLEPCLETPISEVLVITDYLHTEILFFAAVCEDCAWIWKALPSYGTEREDCLEICKSLISTVRFLTHREWHRLFLFLQHYFYNYEVIEMLADAVKKQDPSVHAINWFHVIFCLRDVVREFYVQPYSVTAREKPQADNEDQSLRGDRVVFRALNRLSYLLLPSKQKAFLEATVRGVVLVMSNNKNPIIDDYQKKRPTFLSPIMKQILDTLLPPSEAGGMRGLSD